MVSVRRTLLIVFFLVSPLVGQTFLSTSAQDEHIAAAKRKTIDTAAIDYLKVLLGDHPETAFDLLSQEAQAKLSRDQVSAQGQMMKQLEIANLAVEHSYLVRIKGKAPESIVCARDLTKPDGWDALTVTDLAEQAYVTVVARTRNNNEIFTVWLVPKGTRWTVHSYWMNVSTLGSKDSKELWEIAHHQRELGHIFNAMLFYQAAAQTVNRGPNFQKGLAQALIEDMKDVKAPQSMQGAPPFIWADGSSSYRIVNIGPMAIAGKIYLIINHRTGPWKTEAEVDGRNKELLRYFKHQFPEYASVFAGIAVRADEEGSHRSFGTVEDGVGFQNK